MIRHILFLSILSLTIFSCSQSNNPSINNYFNTLYKEKKFNGNVLIVKSDSIIYENSMGYARGNKNKKLTEEHLFQIGSIYKEFPAMAIMQLNEKGLLSLDDKLSAFIPELPVWASKISVENLLNYSSGLPTVDWPELFQEEEKVSMELALNKLHNIQALEFQPGSDYLYSNYNPFLLIKIIESISALGYQQYLEQNILTPFGLEGIVVSNHYPYADTLSRLFAYPFGADYKEDNMEYELPSICASTEGIRKWFMMVDNFQIISKESVKKISKKAKEGDNIQSPLGRADWENGELQLHLHHGSTGNYECLVRNYKQDNLLIILFTNQKHRNLHEIADDVHDMIGK